MIRFFLIFFTFIQILSAKTIYFVPYPGSNPEVTFYNAKSSIFAKKWVTLREMLEEAGYKVKFTNDAKNLKDVYAIISITNINSKLLANLKSYPKEKCWIFLFEPPVFLPSAYDPSLALSFGKIFVMFDDLIDNKEYFKFHYPQPELKMKEDLPTFEMKKLCVLIAANKSSKHPKELYSERIRAISFFSQMHGDDFDLFGPGWKGFSSWKGVVHNKWEVLENYKFSICYENMKDQFGYITEKIFDCFVSGCVPIYWGANNISDYIPKECYIDRRKFRSHEELYTFIKNMDQKKYEGYLKAIRKYLSSPKARLFSVDAFLELVQEHIASLEHEKI